MRTRLSIAAGLLAAAVLTYGLVYGAMHLASRGFFQWITWMFLSLWTRAHGDIDTFGRWYAHAVHLLCPAIGFGLFWLISRHQIGRRAWKPFAIAVVLACVPFTLHPPPEWVPWQEVARTLVTALLMLASVRAFTASACLTTPSAPHRT